MIIRPGKEQLTAAKSILARKRKQVGTFLIALDFFVALQLAKNFLADRCLKEAHKKVREVGPLTEAKVPSKFTLKVTSKADRGFSSKRYHYATRRRQDAISF
ncbi:MAG: hypothetical protein LBE38_06220 [Deltaproteobacteria bacterium]|jgi:hypothetical protein|nr:hypothetical protein [Deltaproteobacteria bacterium]